MPRQVADGQETNAEPISRLDQKKLPQNETIDRRPLPPVVSTSLIHKRSDVNSTLWHTTEADTLLTDLNDGIRNSPLSGSHGDLKLSLNESELEDCALKHQIEFLKTKTQKAMESVFDISSTVFKVEIKRLSTSHDHIPYESWWDANNNGPRPVIAILSLGAPRPLNLKQGARATHKVPLYPGFYAYKREYTLSVPRGEGSTENKQF